MYSTPSVDAGGGWLIFALPPAPVARLARVAARAKPVSPQSVTYSFVTAALDAGASLRAVQHAAGHPDPRTTRRYDRARYSLCRHPTHAVASGVAA